MERFTHAAKRATEYEAQAKKAKADGQAQAASAFRQRDRVQQLLAEVYNIHAEAKGQCKACKSRYPCSTVKVLERGRDGDAIIRAASRRDDVVDPDWD